MHFRRFPIISIYNDQFLLLDRDVYNYTGYYYYVIISSHDRYLRTTDANWAVRHQAHIWKLVIILLLLLLLYVPRIILWDK